MPSVTSQSFKAVDMIISLLLAKNLHANIMNRAVGKAYAMD